MRLITPLSRSRGLSASVGRPGFLFKAVNRLEANTGSGILFRSLPVLLVFFFMHVLSALAQEQDPSLISGVLVHDNAQPVRISIHVENEPLSETLRTLSQQMGIGLSFRSDISHAQNVTLRMQRAEFHEVVYALLEGTGMEADLSENRRVLVIRPKNEPPGAENAVQPSRNSVTGVVTDRDTGEHLTGVNVIVQGTTTGDATNNEGVYRIERLEDGVYVLQVRYLGFQTREIEVRVEGGQQLHLDIELAAVFLEGEEVMVLSQALGQARAIRQQLDDNRIVNVVSETRLRELPDANAAESIARLPGVAVLRDAGEGQRVAIRGMGPQFSNITIDGNRIPGTSGDRSVDLSMISPEMLTGIEVYKSLRPDMDADAIGGTVNFRMGGVPEGSMYRLLVESGYSGHLQTLGNYKATATGSDRFLDGRLGVMASVNAQKIDRDAHILGSSYDILRDPREDEPHAPIQVRSLDLTDLRSERLRYGGRMTMDWKTDNTQIVLNNIISRQNRDDVRLERIYDTSSNQQRWTARTSETRIQTMSSSLSGIHDLDFLEISWRASRSLSLNDTPFDHLGRFVERSGLRIEELNREMGPDAIPAIAYNRVDQITLDHLENNLREEQQEEWSGSLDIQIPYRMGSFIHGYIKTGGKHYNSSRDRFTTGYAMQSYRLPDFTREEATKEFPWVRNGAGHPLALPFIEGVDGYTILGDRYSMDYMPQHSIVNQLWNNHSDLYYIQLRSRLDDYDALERFSAGYVMSEIQIGSRLMILPGVRYEHERSSYTAKSGEIQSTRDLDETDLDRLADTTAVRDKGMMFPMIQGRFRVTRWFDIRAARTVSVSRPSFSVLSPRFSILWDGAIVSRGNSAIEPARSTNYDLFFTFHHGSFGLFTLGGFYKEVENLIYNRAAYVVNPEEEGLPMGTRLFRIREPVNNEFLTTVHGFELEWQSNLTRLPYPFNGLVVNANYSRFFSEANYHSFEFRRTAQGIVGVDTFRVAPMVHQADHIANVSVGYDLRGFSARVSMQYQGATLRAIGLRPELDRYTDDYLRFDASIRQRFWGDTVSLVANLNNITNREDRSSQFTYDRPLRVENYGAYVDVGVEVRF